MDLSASADAVSARAVLLDIEGTTTSISFVKDTLFPYAVNNVEKFLTSAWENEQVQNIIEGMRLQSTKDVEAKIDGAVIITNKDSSKEDQVDSVSKNLKWLISIDNKGTFMKELSGLIWESGYENGEIKGHIYDDVKPAIEKWKENGKKIFIYSSGSVHAQKLIMKYSISGTLETLIDGYFDTNVGHKREVTSYKNISEKIGFAPEEILFLTDIFEEANAAKDAGMSSIILSREGNASIPDDVKEKYVIIKSFDEINFISSLKRKSSTEEKEEKPAKMPKSELNGVEEKNGIIEELPISDKDSEMEVENTSNNKMEQEEEKVSSNSPVSKEETNSPAVIKENPDELVKTEGLKEDSDKELIPEKMETENNENASNVDTDVEKTDILKDDNKDKELVNIDKTLKENDVVKINNGDEHVNEKHLKNDDISAKNNEKEKPESNENQNVSKEDQVNAVDVDEDKLNELLGEKGIELENECKEILFKVDQVTNIDLIAPKMFKSPKDKLDELDDLQLTEDVETDLLVDVESNNEKISIDDFVSIDTLDKIIPKEPINEESNNSQTNVIESSQEIEKKDTLAENITNCTSVAKDEISEEVNGKDETATVNGHTTNGTESDDNKVNGSSTESCTEHEKTSTDTTTPNGTVTENSSTEGVSDQSEIKVKKIATEETPPETVVEQPVEA